MNDQQSQVLSPYRCMQVFLFTKWILYFCSENTYMEMQKAQQQHKPTSGGATLTI